jgi:hypothetical protein
MATHRRSLFKTGRANTFAKPAAVKNLVLWGNVG